ncbi:MAG: glycosyltransferase [Pyrinomonadaceae bacterium]
MQKSVLHLIPSFHQGGSEQQAVQLVKLLQADGTYCVHVACLEKEGVLLDEIETAGLTDIPEFRLNSFYDANMVRQLRRCSKFIRDNKIDIIQTHDFYTNIFGMAAATMARVQVRIAAKRETGMRSSTQRFIERRAFGFAHSVVTNAERVKNYLVESGVPRSKISVIYNGVDLERLSSTETARENILRELGLPACESMQFVTIVANLRSAVKNHRMFLQAAAKVKSEVVHVGFVIAGEGELIDQTKAFAADLGLSEQTFFLGRCSKVAELLSISNICCLTSESEGFSNSILEYMAAGKPIVATDVGGAAEAVVENETGFLVASDDDEALADRLIELLTDRDKAERMGDNARQVAEAKFSLTARKKKTLELYGDQLERVGHR